MLMLRCALVMCSEGYVPEDGAVTPLGHDLSAVLVGFLQMVAEHPWEALPPEVADVLRPELPALADEIVAELSRGVPDYARPLEGPFGQALRSRGGGGARPLHPIGRRTRGRIRTPAARCT